MASAKKLDLQKGLCGGCLSVPLPGFFWGGLAIFEGSESGQIQSIRKEGGGRVEPESMGGGQQGKYRSQSWVKNTNMTESNTNL